MMAVTPASIASWGRRRRGSTRPKRGRAGEQLRLKCARLLDRDAHRVDAAHLPRSDPDRRTIARDHDRVRAHVAADRPREQQLLPLDSLGSFAPIARICSRVSRRRRGSARARRRSRACLPSRARRRPLRELEQAHVLLRSEHLERLRVETGREQHLDELLGELARETRRRRAG